MRARSSAWGLEPRRNVLFVGRLEPENNSYLLVEACANIRGARPGHEARRRRAARPTPPSTSFACAAADPRVVFPGYIFGRGYWELQRNAYLFCAPTRSRHLPGHPRGAGRGNCVVVNDHARTPRTAGTRGRLLGRGGRARPGAQVHACSATPSRGLLPRARPGSARRGLLCGTPWPTSTRCSSSRSATVPAPGPCRPKRSTPRAGSAGGGGVARVRARKTTYSRVSFSVSPGALFVSLLFKPGYGGKMFLTPFLPGLVKFLSPTPLVPYPILQPPLYSTPPFGAAPVQRHPCRCG